MANTRRDGTRSHFPTLNPRHVNKPGHFPKWRGLLACLFSILDFSTFSKVAAWLFQKRPGFLAEKKVSAGTLIYLPHRGGGRSFTVANKEITDMTAQIWSCRAIFSSINGSIPLLRTYSSIHCVDYTCHYAALCRPVYTVQIKQMSGENPLSTPCLFVA